MRAMRWVFVAAVLATAAAIVAVGACVIDDDPTWINNEACSGACTTRSTGDFSCDVDSTCTPAAGCEDWDCNEYDGTGLDAGLDAMPPGDATRDGAYDDDAGSGGDGGEDVPIDPTACRPFGGGETRDAPRDITLGVTLAELRCCPETSQWFRFVAAAGARFHVAITPLGAGQLTFLLYAEDGTVLAGAEMSDDAAFAADAGVAGSYLLRVRSLGDVPADYALIVTQE